MIINVSMWRKLSLSYSTYDDVWRGRVQLSTEAQGYRSKFSVDKVRPVIFLIKLNSIPTLDLAMKILMCHCLNICQWKLCIAYRLRGSSIWSKIWEMTKTEYPGYPQYVIISLPKCGTKTMNKCFTTLGYKVFDVMQVLDLEILHQWIFEIGRKSVFSTKP